NDANVRLFRLNDEIIQILLSGKLPEQTNWQPVPMDQFPANGRIFASNQIDFTELFHFTVIAFCPLPFAPYYTTPPLIMRIRRSSLFACRAPF
ncbi:MAG: hypothetical protein ACKV1O_22320, partial [Saprospiraceae bacterium]